MDSVSLALEIGFSHAGTFDPAVLRALSEVRDMCAADRCRMYGRSWSCPPACGTVEENEARMHAYRNGLLVQTTANLADDFDAEAMEAAARLHKRRFETLARQLRLLADDALPLSAGTCTVCASCTYPLKPCRFPDRMFSSMEAYGLLVSDVCREAGLSYYYGPKTLTYSSCILWNEGSEPK